MTLIPSVPNKHNLKPSDIPKLQVLHREKLQHSPFWYNQNIKAWCVTRDTGSENDFKYGSENKFWMGIFDDGRIEYTWHTLGGMLLTDFDEFYDEYTLANKPMLQLHEAVLEVLNRVIDDGILGLPQTEQGYVAC